MNRKQRRRCDRRSEVKIRQERLKLEAAQDKVKPPPKLPTQNRELLLPGVWAAIGMHGDFPWRSDKYCINLTFHPLDLMGWAFRVSADPWHNVSYYARMIAADIARKVEDVLLKHGGFN